MEVIIAGGRNFKPKRMHYKILHELHKEHIFTKIHSGKANGADTFGEEFAKIHQITVVEHPANWEDIEATPCVIKTNKRGTQYNCLAGFVRNEDMAISADAVVLFKGGSGTNDMRKRAITHNLTILYDEPTLNEK